MKKNKLKSSYVSSRPQPLVKSSYRSNSLHKYSPKARLTRLIITLAIIFAAFFTVLALVVFPKINIGKQEESVVVALPTPDPTPNPYSALIMPDDIEYVEDMASWVKTDVYDQPVELKRAASESSDTLMTLVDRENVIVKGISGDWSLVLYNRQYGFIKTKVIYQGAIPAVPEVINEVLVTDLISGINKKSQLVNVQEVVPGITVDLQLANEENYLGTKIYPVSIALLQKQTAAKLKEAQALFNQDGYTIVLWDAYCPYSTTLEIEELFGGTSELIEPASRGSRNNRGTSVDITIAKKDGTPVVMPSDGMTLNEELAARVFSTMTEEAKANVKYMSSIMRRAGFITSDAEWWHFDDADWQYYPVMDYDLFDF
ncbi:MAG: M15 family metallopeptidase [Eubacteriales bacterium]